MRPFRFLALSKLLPVVVLLSSLVVLASCAGPVGQSSNNDPKPQAPSINTQPANVTVVEGNPATFSVNASGTAPLQYQWMQNGSAIMGATSVTYTINSATMSQNGATFSVAVSNSAGNLVSNPATLTVNAASAAPAITSQPVSQTITAGQNATFTVAANGTAPLTYQWLMNGSNIANSNSASYTVTNATTAQSGATFAVTVSNSAGSVTSVTATLTVNAAAVAPSITSQPANQTVTAGQNATFAVAANGTAPLTYQWQMNGSNIANSNSASYTVSNTTTAQSGTMFDVVVSNSAGSVTSDAVKLTVNAAPTAPSITTQPASQTVTAGQNATFSVVAVGTAPLNYQWQLNGTNIPNANAASYTISNTTTSESGQKFDVVVSNTAGNVTSNMATLTVNPAPVAPSITTQPSNTTVTEGQNATFTVVASGTAPLTYQWQMNGANIANSNSASYTVANTTTGQSGETFDVIVSNTTGSITSHVVTLTVTAAAVAPTISTQPGSTTVTAGQNATFTVVAAGTAPLTYQWQMNGSNIANSNSASYTVTSTTTAQSGEKFDVIVSNTAGSVTSSMATLTVNAATPPSITTQPASKTVTAGQNATFTVVATGTAPLTYQWRVNSTNIPDSNSASYTVTSTTTAQNGEKVDVIVSNTAGSVTSAAATLTVNPVPVAPTISSQPVSQTVTAGQNATFTVIASGTAPLTYQWRMNSANIANSNSASYTVTSTTTAQSGEKFDVIVSNATGSVTSSMATLTVNPAPVAPSITTQPGSTTVTAGQNATFTVVAAGTAPLTYQWRMNGSNIANSNSASYTVTSTTTAMSGEKFDVIVSNTAGSVTSNMATLTVNPAPVAPAITTQPLGQTVTAGQNATFTVAASGTAPLTYQWQLNSANIANSNSPSYTVTNTTLAENGEFFDVIITNTAGSVTSNSVKLTVNPAPVAPTITTQPTSKTVTAGQNATFTVVASGTAPLSYQWQLNGSNISGANSASYTVTNTTTSESGEKFDVIVSNTAGSVTSNMATLTVNPVPVAPTITTQPANQSVTAGQNATFTVVAAGTAPLTYQWQLNGSNISGANTASYTVTSTTTAMSGEKFDVIVSNTAGNVTSTMATLTVTAAAVAPGITTQPTNQTVTAGQNATFTVVATGTAPLTYQWQMNGSNIANSNSPSYTVTNTTTGESGETFDVIITNTAGNITSNTVTLTVNAATAPSITTQPTNQTVTAGQNATFTVVAAGTAPLTYQWQLNGGNIANSNSASYTVSNTTTGQSGETFDVIVTNAAGNITSNTVTLTVNPVSTGSGIDVVTYHNDVARTGLNSSETALTTANVNFHTFGLILTVPVDGKVDAEPLFLSSVTVSGTAHDILYIATENDSVYAVDANTYTTLWHDGPGILLPSGETPSDEPFSCDQIGPEIGITSTPAIDRSAGPNGTMFLVTMSVDGGGNHHQRIHALDVTTGAELLGGPTEIQATYPGVGAGSSGGVLTFAPISYKERAALLLLNGTIYTTWASHCDAPPYSPWVIGYSESTLAQNVVFNLAPNGANTSNGQYGAGAVWMSGGGPAADPQGNFYIAMANGAFETTLNGSGFPSQADYGNALVKLTPGTNSLAVTDYFNMSGTLNESTGDKDLGSGGVMVLPDLTASGGATKQLVVAAGKDRTMYVADRTNMGKFNASSDHIYQELVGALPSGIWAVAAYFNNTIYYCDLGGTLKGFPVTNALVGSTPVQSVNGYNYPGLLPSVSANGTSNGIVWGVENTTTAALHAFDAVTLGELYNTKQAPNGEDTFGGGNKFITPMIANGKVFVATPNSVAIFGLLSTPR